MKTTLDYKKDFLCVLKESEISDGPRGAVLVKAWHPVHAAEEAEVRTLVGRPVTVVNPDEGIYVDEEGNVFQLAEKGRSKPIGIERSALERELAVGDAQTSTDGGAPQQSRPSEGVPNGNHHGKARKEKMPTKNGKRRPVRGGSANGSGSHIDGAAREDTGVAAPMFAQLSLRQKLAVVRRRIAYVQKRGHNER